MAREASPVFWETYEEPLAISAAGGPYHLVRHDQPDLRARTATAAHEETDERPFNGELGRNQLALQLIGTTQEGVHKSLASIAGHRVLVFQTSRGGRAAKGFSRHLPRPVISTLEVRENNRRTRRLRGVLAAVVVVVALGALEIVGVIDARSYLTRIFQSDRGMLVPVTDRD